MTVTTDLSRIPYVAAGGELVLPIPFTIQNVEDLVVYRTQTGGSATLLVYGTHYTITGLGDPTASLSLVAAATAGDLFTLLRIVPVLQLLNLRNQGGYFPETLEKAGLDRIVMMIQQMDDLLSTTDPSIARALLLAVDGVIGSSYYDALSNKISNMDDPVASQDAATKVYVDTAVAGVSSGGGASFVFSTVTAVALPAPSAAFSGLVYLVRDAGLPDVLKVCLRQSNGTTYEWCVLTSASA